MIGLDDGGMCELHHATDTKLRREVTIKDSAAAFMAGAGRITKTIQLGRISFRC